MITKKASPIFRLGIPLLMTLGLAACAGDETGSTGSSSSSGSTSSGSSSSGSSTGSSTSSTSTSSTSSSSGSSSSSSSSTTSSGNIGNWPLVIGINAGSNSSAMFEGDEYQADRYASGGSSHDTSDPIGGVTEDTIYQTERYGTYSYNVPVTAGTFSVKLHFAELYNEEAGLRSFNVNVEGQQVIRNLDLYSVAGHDGAYSYTVDNVRVNDGSLDIDLETVSDNATLSAFALYSADGEVDTSVVVSDCRGYVGITYDDGPVNTTAFVNALRQAELVPVTFFINGSQIGGNSSSIAQMLTVGEVQSHAYSHNDMGGYSYQQAYDELERNSQAIMAAGAPAPTVFRPPYGSHTATTRQAASDLGMVTITWDVDSQDWNGASVSSIVASNRQLSNGDVILMHENQSNSLNAIPQIAAALKENGMCPGRLDPNTGRAIAP